ncbi:ATP-binding cassette domain-containing protein [Bosea eneae]|jgi:iron complex transport system ATP-binding protein|uniref:ATP-binding cassette domain-containing protein n=1 Tax=Bosea eneae TaxID=151454 RepID=A0ABW0IQM6_9HYPH
MQTEAIASAAGRFSAAPQAIDAGPQTSGPLFTLEEVGFSIAGRVLLEPLSLDLGAGKVIGILGHNGSGKSTMVKLLARQQQPSRGVLSYAGRPIESWDNRAFARRVAYLPQQTPPAAGMLVKELVALGRYPWHGALGRFGRRDRDKVGEAMALTDIEPFAERLVDTLSGGERQRAWLAMLVAQDAQCLLLDEPIAALDLAHQMEVLTLVQRLSHEHGLGIVVVLHDVNMAARFCDELIALHSGRLVARGTPDEIVRPDVLRMIYGVEVGVIAHPHGGRPLAFV